LKNRNRNRCVQPTLGREAKMWYLILIGRRCAH